MVIKTVVTNALQENCYILSKEGGKEAVLIDPGFRSLKIISDYLSESGLTVTTCLLTHGHFDHIFGVKLLQEQCVKVLCDRKEERLLASESMNGSTEFRCHASAKADGVFDDGDVLDLCGIRFKVIETPGHTAGSVCFYVEDEGVIFTGDTLFYRSCGRTDFMTGNEAELASSFRDILFKLPGDTVCFPGHGEETTIEEEKTEGPFANGI